MKKKLFIHIGSHKTATTHLQNMLTKTRAALLELGILYPLAGIKYDAHHPLAWSLNDTNQSGHHLESSELWKSLIAECQSSTARSIIISSEDFEWSQHSDKLNFLNKIFDLHVIFYWRKPDSYLESYYNQIVKDYDTRETRTIEEYICETSLFFLNTKDILNKWERLVGLDKIHVRIYEDAVRSGDITHDLLKALGADGVIELPAADHSVSHKTSLPPDLLEFLRLTNKNLKSRDGHFELILRLVREIAKEKDAYQLTRGGLLSLKTKINILATRHNQNLAVANRYLKLAYNPFPADSAREHPNYEKRLGVANTEIVARIASALIAK